MDDPAGNPVRAVSYAFGAFRLEVRERRLWRGGRLIVLQPKVFDTLALLVENAGHLMTKEALMAALWPDAVVEESNLTKNIWSIRKALGDSEGTEGCVETVPRVGYRFIAPVRPETPPGPAPVPDSAPASAPAPPHGALAGEEKASSSEETEEPDRELPSRIGPYEIVAPLGAGGMGRVYRGRDHSLHRDVAIKVLPASLARDPDRLRRFEQEARAAGALNHPGVTAVYELGTHEGEPYIVTELLQGETLRARLAPGPLPPRRALDFAVQIAEALAAAHERGVIHRDLKPENLFVTSDGRIKILDFGLAKRRPEEPEDAAESSASSADTEPGSVLGTTGYMSPEQVRGLPADERSDLFSLGCVLSEMLTGRRAFQGETGAETMAAILRDEPADVAAVAPSLAPDVARIVRRCLEKNPAERFQSSRDLAFALSAAASAPSGPAGASAESIRSPSPARRPVRRAQVLAVGVTLLAVAVAAGLLVRRQIARARPSARPTRTSTRARKSIAILGLRNLSGHPGQDWLSTALSAMVTAELAAGEELRIVPAENVARRRTTPPPGALAAETLASLRSALDADEVVLGSYIALPAADGEQIRVDLLVQDTGSGETLAAVSETGTESDLFRLVSAAGAGLRLKLGLAGRTAVEAAAVAASLPRNPAATRLYAEGLDHLHRGEASAARDILLRATEAEPDFALAHAALSEAWMTLGYDVRAEEEARKAVEHSEGLSREERLRTQAQLARARKKWEEAIELYQALWTWFPDDIEYGLRQAQVQIAGGHPQAAVQTVAALRRLSGGQADDPRIDLVEADAAAAASNSSGQLAAARRAVDKAHRLGAKMILAQARLTEGAALDDLGNAEDAKPKYEEARTLYRDVGDRAGEATAIRSLAGLLLTRDPPAARKLYTQSLDMSAGIGDRHGEAASLTDMINLDWIQPGNLTLVDKELERLQELYQEVGDRSGIAWALNGIGTVAWDQGDLDRAMRLHREALAISREISKPGWEAWSLVCIGDVAHSAGDLKSAGASYEEAIAIQTRLRNESARAGTLTMLADLRLDMGDLPGARAAAQEALSIRTKLGENETRAQTALTLADTLTASGKALEAVGLSEQARAEFQKDQETGNEALALATLIRSLLALGRTRDAKNASDKARLLLRGSQVNEVLPAQLACARADAAAGLAATAREETQGVLAKANRIGWVNYQLDARLALAQIDLGSGQQARARAELTALERDAKANGFGRYAEEASLLLRDGDHKPGT